MIKQALWMIAVICISMGAAAQTQAGIVRTLERPGKPSNGITGVTINVMEYPNAIVSKKGGKFSFTIPGKRQGDSYTVSRVQKKGYTLVDKQLKGRRFAYSSSVSLEIVMVADEQLEMDKKRIEDKAYDKAQKDYNQKVAALERQLKEKTISEREYRTKYEELNSNYNNYIQLIDQMAERYATTDYKGLSETNKDILACVENADLERADELINRKGSFDKREEELLKKMQLKEKSEQLSQQLQEDIDVELEDLVRDYYNKYTINAAAYRNDSAAYYLERIVRLDTTDVDMIRVTAWFIDNYLADYPRALDYYQRALVQAQEQYGELSEQAGQITEFIGLTYDHLQEQEKSLEWHLKALDIYEQTEGLLNPDAALVYTHIGRIYSQKGECEKALEYTLKGLEIRERTFEDKDHLDFSQSYNNLGVIYNQMKDYEKALVYHKKALDIRERVLGTNSDGTALSYLNIGDVYYRQEQFDSASVYLQKALDIYQLIYGSNHPTTYNALIWNGANYQRLENFEKALECFQQALNFCDNYYGEESEQSAYCCQLVATVYHQLGDIKKTIAYIQRCIDIYEKTYGPDYQAVQQLKEGIERLKGE